MDQGPPRVILPPYFIEWYTLTGTEFKVGELILLKLYASVVSGNKNCNKRE